MKHSDLTVDDVNVFRDDAANPQNNWVNTYKHADKKGWTNAQLAFYLNTQRGASEERTEQSVADHREWLTSRGLLAAAPAAPSLGTAPNGDALCPHCGRVIAVQK